MIDLAKWWRGGESRLPLFGRLTDYATLVQRYNVALVSRANVGAGLNQQLTIGPDTNRVALWITANIAVPTQAVDAEVVAGTPTGPMSWIHTLVAKAVDTAAVTPSPLTYSPLLLTVTDFGPLIQGPFTGFAAQGVNYSFLELLINPELAAAMIGQG